jgi:acyl carrier protein
MTITEQLVELLSIATDRDPEDIPAEASMETFPPWDSLAQINLCLMIQDRFAIQLELDEISENTSLAALAALVSRRQTNRAA